MENKLHFLQTEKTARVFTFGEFNNQTKYIWILLHGYAQTADHLLDNFKSLGEEHYLIAPEGLNHFYARGLSGAPVASWMTSLMREQQIHDYITYLNRVYSKFASLGHCKVILAGFSQGVSTLSRWVNAGFVEPNHLVFIAGNIANEMHQEIPVSISKLKNLYLYGSNDVLINKESVLKLEELFNENTQFIEFTGKHEVNEDCISKIKTWLLQQN